VHHSLSVGFCNQISLSHQSDPIKWLLLLNRLWINKILNIHIRTLLWTSVWTFILLQFIFFNSKLQQADVFISNKEDCRAKFESIYYPTVDESMLCATNFDHMDSCARDSGGPLFQKKFVSVGQEKKIMYTQFGITSWGIPLCKPTPFPGKKQGLTR
jgi:hypothetical protein